MSSFADKIKNAGQSSQINDDSSSMMHDPMECNLDNIPPHLLAAGMSNITISVPVASTPAVSPIVVATTEDVDSVITLEDLIKSGVPRELALRLKPEYLKQIGRLTKNAYVRQWNEGRRKDKKCDEVQVKNSVSIDGSSIMESSKNTSLHEVKSEAMEVKIMDPREQLFDMLKAASEPKSDDITTGTKLNIANPAVSDPKDAMIQALIQRLDKSDAMLAKLTAMQGSSNLSSVNNVVSPASVELTHVHTLKNENGEFARISLDRREKQSFYAVRDSPEFFKPSTVVYMSRIALNGDNEFTEKATKSERAFLDSIYACGKESLPYLKSPTTTTGKKKK